MFDYNKDEMNTTQNTPAMMSEIKSLLDMTMHLARKLADLEEKCTDNMKRLNTMMLEMKGLTAMIRPQVKKTGWYGEEVNVKPNHKFQEKVSENGVRYIEVPADVEIAEVISSCLSTVSDEVKENQSNC